MKSTMEDILLCLSVKYKGNFNKIIEAISNRERPSEEEIREVKRNLKCNYITAISENYPDALKKVDCPPVVIYYYGDISLLDKKIIDIGGIVDSTEYGDKTTEKIVKELVENDYVIASGFAKGINTVAHRIAIENGGKTIAFLPCGIDLCIREENKELYEIMKESHLIISEYPFETEMSGMSVLARKDTIRGSL